VFAVIFRALACDYDGTLAWDDVIAPATAAAVRRAREAGVRVVLATGRTFFDLTRVCADLELFDAVVAENGAVLYYPGQAMIRDQPPPPSPRLLAELDRRGIAYQLGRVIVGTARADEARVREALEAAEVSLQVIYNRAALMLLAAHVSKGSGVRQALQAFGLSPHDVLALGDAENDLELFEACEWRGCPENAVPELRARAEMGLPGHRRGGDRRGDQRADPGRWPGRRGIGPTPGDARLGGRQRRGGLHP
jgi:hydroxymethylpyrimidine pyrophosphatase-like HAD family hydrolase